MANVSDNKLVYKAWQKKADIDLFDHIDYFHMRGLKYLKVVQAIQFLKFKYRGNILV